MKGLLPKKTLSKTIPIPSPGPGPGQPQKMHIDVGNSGAAVVDFYIQVQPAEERIITKERYDDLEYNQVRMHEPKEKKLQHAHNVP